MRFVYTQMYGLEREVMWREVLSEFLQPVVVPCADVILSAAARRVIVTGGGGGAPVVLSAAARVKTRRRDS